jgi:putative nucleotidyltransferase with HDIG domain
MKFWFVLENVTVAMTAIGLVQNVKNLPPVSQAALKLISLLDKPAVDNDEIVQILKYDTVMTAKLLKACNAPSFGLSESVSSVDQAVLILGHQQIFHIVMTLAFGSIMTVSSLAYTMEMNVLWEHSLLSAMAAEIVLERLPGLNAEPNVAFTASLLHDIGKVVLAQALTTEQLAEIRDRIIRRQIPGTEAEREVLQFDHCEVGAALLKNWRLPENIVEATANHHRPLLQPRPRLSATVHICNAIAHCANPLPGQTPHEGRIADEVTDEFDISAEKLEEMVVAVHESSEHMDKFMAMV